MGLQLIVERDVMLAAGWSFEDIVVRDGYVEYDDSDCWPEWVSPIVYRRWSHPEKGELMAYAVEEDCFCADCNGWGENRAIFEAAGLFDLKYFLG